MLLSFLFLGVGYGGAGFNLSELFTSNNDSTDTTLTADQKVAALEARLQQNPKDVTTLWSWPLCISRTETCWERRPTWSRSSRSIPLRKRYTFAWPTSTWLKTWPSTRAAAAILNKAISVDPNNPDIYLKLGIAQNALGNVSATVLAWQKYLALAPNGDMASVVREQVAKLAQQATTTTTTASSSTTTTAGSTSTTAGSISSTTTTAP